MENLEYCMGCDENVPVNPVTRAGNIELTCVYCGFTLSIVVPEKRRKAHSIAIVEDAELTRKIISDLLTSKKLTDEAYTFKDGEEFVSFYSKYISEKNILDLVILDIEIPRMNGFTVARIMRALEKKLDHQPCPIIFFSGRRADHALKKQLSLFSPVRYLNKGSAGDINTLKLRVETLVSHLDIFFAEKQS